MGIGIGTAIALTALFAGGVALAFLSQSKQDNQDQLQPAELDDFGPTQVKEGAPIPIIYGKVRIPGNLIYYGRLITEAIKEKVSGGKGGAGGSQKRIITGFKYFIDAWQHLCMGQIEIEEYIIEDRVVDLASRCDDLIFNDGVNGNFSTRPGPFASPINGTAHVYLQKWFMGENVNSLPTVHFVCKRLLNYDASNEEITTPFTNADLSNGSNPAAIVYDIFVNQCGNPESLLVMDDLFAAADYFEAKGYGLNLKFKNQQEAFKWLNSTVQYIDAVFYRISDGRYTFKPLDPNESPKYFLSDVDYKNLVFTRDTYEKTPNVFNGTFVDQDDNFATRTVVAKNPANIDLSGPREVSVDLKAFSTSAIASKRLWEIAQQSSYPKSRLTFTTSLKQEVMEVGDIIQLSNSLYGIAQEQYRITQVDVSNIDDNELSWAAEQHIETLFDPANFIESGKSEAEFPEYSVEPFENSRIFELPFNTITGFESSFLMLVPRNGNETSWQVLFSNTGSDFQGRGEFSTFAQTGLLGEDYPDNTFAIDDIQGVLYTPFREDPVFESISRTDLFAGGRIAIINDEILAFQTVTPEGANDIRLTGVIRGVLNTPIQSHSVGDRIYLVEPNEFNILTGVTIDNFFVKFIPIFGDVSGNAADVVAIPASYTKKALTPWSPGRLSATRTGSSIDLTWLPRSKFHPLTGAGLSTASQTPETPEYEGDFIVEYNTSQVVTGGLSETISEASQVDVSVKHRVSGLISEAIILTVPALDGTYTIAQGNGP